MKKIFLILLLFVSFAFSTIDEYKTDVYFGNGILTEEKDARSNALKILSPAIEEDIYGTEAEMRKYIGKVDYTYNRTEGPIPDLLESALQKLYWDFLTDFFSPSHSIDVSAQVTAYVNSIEKGHKVFVVTV